MSLMQWFKRSVGLGPLRRRPRPADLSQQPANAYSKMWWHYQDKMRRDYENKGTPWQK